MKQKEPTPMTIQCSDCRQEFTFSVGEQEFFADRNLMPPKRCRDCRAARKAKRD